MRCFAILLCVFFSAFVQAENITESGSRISMFSRAIVQIPEFLSQLNDESKKFTIFAPTNEAITDAITGALARIKEYMSEPCATEIIKRIVAGHIVTEEIYADQIEGPARLGTLMGNERLIISRKGSDIFVMPEETSYIMTRRARVVIPDAVRASNGVFHGIDAVLVPASLERVIIPEYCLGHNV
ncbi:Fasciclin domain-containing protein [Jimgerdemannia flammicorona]|uniref:Fasciclin domain-containing protein n=1 Tax=Jimgerdemannia flammicorona TaxID=994334 RepID=A0A433DJU2_9FUNG|nr:Fasciclin domain-containing protein [Jimgerdemannia flammicorona]